MAVAEKLNPRELFTKKLVRICQRLDEASSRVTHKNFLYKAVTSQLEITSLGVVGSYARGAMTCGDLDLVLEYKLIEGNHPAPSTLTKTFFGFHQYVRYYFGLRIAAHQVWYSMTQSLSGPSPVADGNRRLNQFN
ncbi:hypothetical protein [Pseudomonas sp. PB3P13]